MKKLPFGFNRPESSPGFLLWQTTTIWQRNIKKALEKYDISHSQFVILAVLMCLQLQNGDNTQKTLTEYTKLDKMTVSKSLKKLALMGFVDRFENEDDTRSKKVILSKKGIDIVNLLVPIIEGIDNVFFSRISKGEEKMLISFLRKLSED